MKALYRFARFLRADLRLIVVILVALAAGTALGLVGPILIGDMVNVVKAAAAAPAAGSRELGTLLPLAGLMLLATAGAGALQFGRGYMSELLAQRTMLRTRDALYAHLHNQGFAYFDSQETGQLISRVTGDVETLRRLISRVAPGALAAAVQFVGTAIALLVLDVRLALIALCVAPFFVWTTRSMSRQLRPASWRVQQQLADLTTVLQEVISSIRVVKAFVRSDYEAERFEGENQGYLDRSMEVARLQARYQPLLGQLPTFGTVAVLGYGGWQVVNGHLSLGMFVTFNAFVVQLLGPLRMLSMLVNMAATAGASAERIMEILDSSGGVQQPEHPLDPGRLRGEVRLDGVWTRYRRSGDWVLQAVDLHVRPGQSLALVGMTGAGKSTLVQLIPRFYDPERGRVLIDGQDVRTLDLRSLRAQVGFVLQDPFLFSGTVEDNIRYGRPGANLHEVRAAAESAHIAEFVESLPQGYRTLIGERGVGLSGGQKQRMAIARALVTDPRILILDDATSSVDAENEHLIWDALRRLMAGRTNFIIAHRLASVMFADHIAVIEDGRVAALGTHQELLSTSPLYRRIHDLQLAPGEQTVLGGGLLA